MPEWYEIKIKGQLDERWSEWFAGFTVVQVDQNTTLLSGWLADQPALHGLLERIRDLNIPLLSVTTATHPEEKPGSD